MAECKSKGSRWGFPRHVAVQALCAWKLNAWDEAGKTSTEEYVAVAKFSKIDPLSLLVGPGSPGNLV